MGRLIYAMMASLDGYIAGPNGELDWAVIDEELHEFINQRERAMDGFLYGRRTYELMADFWPAADADPNHPAYIAEYARIWKSKPKLVFSHSLAEIDAVNARLAKCDLADEAAHLKAQDGQAFSLGGAQIAAELLRSGLVDEVEVYLQPVLLGKGQPLFPTLDPPLKLRLLETRTFGSGVVYLHYQVEKLS